MSTVFSGERIDAVSAMKCTPQNAMTSASAAAALARQAERVADVVGDVLHLGHLVVVGQDDRVASRGERADLGGQRATFVGRQGRWDQWGWGAMGRFMAHAPG